MRKRKRFSDRPEQSEEMSLQITSMADIFTIILVFLLKSYSTGVSNVTPSHGILLPEAHAHSEIKDRLKLEIQRDAVLIDQKPAAHLKNFSFPDGKSEEVYSALMRERRKSDDENGESQLLVLADQKTPYATLKKVMNSAASAGYVDLQLAVVQAE